MLRRKWLLLGLLLASLACGPVRAAPEIAIVPALPEAAWAVPGKVCNGFAADELSLTVRDHGKQVAGRVFCSSYGRAKARVIIDRSGWEFILLEYSTGHGTNDTTEYLELDRLDVPQLVEILRVPLSWGVGPVERFTYGYAVALPASGGVRIVLRGRVSGQATPGVPRCCTPSSRNFTVSVSD